MKRKVEMWESESFEKGHRHGSMNMLHRIMQNCKGKGVKMVSMNLF